MKIRLDECIPYLAPERPTEERFVLLALCILQLGGRGERYWGKASSDKVKAVAKVALNAEVCPPRFELLALALARSHSVGLNVAELIEPGRRADTARRILAGMSGALRTLRSFRPSRLEGRHFRKPVRALFETVLALGEQHAGQVVEEWYRSEPDPAMRKIVLDTSLSWRKDPAWSKRREAILKLAVQDWDEKIPAEALEQLMQLGNRDDQEAEVGGRTPETKDSEESPEAATASPEQGARPPVPVPPSTAHETAPAEVRIAAAQQREDAAAEPDRRGVRAGNAQETTWAPFAIGAAGGMVVGAAGMWLALRRRSRGT